MSTKSRVAAPKGSKKGPKAETFYAQTLHAYFLSAFHGVHQSIIKTRLPEGIELMSVRTFLEGTADVKALHYDPTPRTVKLIIHLIVAIHDRAIASIKADSPVFLRVLESIAEPRNASLRSAIDPRGMINGTFSVASRGTKVIDLGRAVAAMDRLVKAIAEAMVSCVLISGHLPGNKTYLPALCQAANLPTEIIDMANALPPLPTKSKAGGDKAAPAAAAAPVPAPAPASDEGSDAEESGDDT